MATTRRKAGDGPVLTGAEGHTPYAARMLPFEIGPLDLATRGGAHTGLINLITGPPRAGKTVAALKLLRSFLRRDTRRAVYFAGENKYDPAFMEVLGIPLDRVVIEPPDYQDVIYDMIMETVETAGDCGLVIVDSIRSMVVRRRFKEDAFSDPYNQFSPEASATNQLMGMLNIAQAKRARMGSPITLLFINHEGLAPPSFPGSPPQRVIPRGKNQLYASSLRFRFFAPEYLKERHAHGMKLSPQVRFRFQIEGNRIGATGISGDFCMNQIAHTVVFDGDGTDDPRSVVLAAGTLDDVDFWYLHGKEVGYIHGGGAAWMVGERGPFRNRDAIFWDWLTHRDQYQADQDAILPLAIQEFYARF